MGEAGLAFLVVHLYVAAFDHLGDVLQHLGVLIERLEVRDLTARVTERDTEERERESERERVRMCVVVASRKG